MRTRIALQIFFVAIVISAIGLILGWESFFEGRGRGINGTMPRSFWLILIAIPLFVAISVLGYVTLFPEISEKKIEEKQLLPVVERGESTLDAVLRVLKGDEKKVIETLVTEGGTMLQKDIRWKTGFSRVKTHRIIYRLTERGIVSTEKHYNTNKITLADWLSKEKSE